MLFRSKRQKLNDFNTQTGNYRYIHLGLRNTNDLEIFCELPLGQFRNRVRVKAMSIPENTLASDNFCLLGISTQLVDNLVRVLRYCKGRDCKNKSEANIKPDLSDLSLALITGQHTETYTERLGGFNQEETRKDAGSKDNKEMYRVFDQFLVSFETTNGLQVRVLTTATKQS